MQRYKFLRLKPLKSTKNCDYKVWGEALTNSKDMIKNCDYKTV